MSVSRKRPKLFRTRLSKIRIYVLFTRGPLSNDSDVAHYLARKNISIVPLNHVKNLDDLSYTMGKII